jgi:formylglycine-generating enzyme required for sulfatase activity
VQTPLRTGFRALPLMLGAMAWAVSSTGSAPAQSVAFLAVETALEEMGPHNQAAWDAARTLCDATLLLADGRGGFREVNGRSRVLEGFDAVWHHQGDSIARTLMHSPPYPAVLKSFAEGGGGVLLSGGALAIIDGMGLEPHVRTQRRQLENYRDPAGMVPVDRSHPIFSDWRDTSGVIGLSQGGCPAVADFYWGGPAEGVVLANTPTGVERPLVEYRLGAGRLIVLGWRWPDYADGQNPHRANLLRLTGNLLAYLADAAQWRPLVIPSQFPAVAGPKVPGIAAPRWRALRLAIADLTETFAGAYTNGHDYLARLTALEAEQAALPSSAGPEAHAPIIAQFDALQREALLANPLLDFPSLLLIRRRADRLGLPMNYEGNTDLEPTGYDNTLVTLSPPAPGGRIETVFRPANDVFIGDVDLHYDGEKLLVSLPDPGGRWGVGELHLPTGTLTPLPLIDEPDVHNYDACYLPDDRIVFTSTAPFIGVPCVGGQSQVANLYLLDHQQRVRRLTHDQDHNWCPAVLNTGRILYQRWEYADIAHAFTRLLFHANPDGSAQMEYYGGNSFWPTAMFYARPIPDHPTMIVTVVGGHHDAPRQGELILLDPALGRREAGGVVQRIPGFGQPVQPVILDGLISASWPRFLHPYPLNQKYFLVSCKPTRTSHWGVYLVDVFDNFVLLHEEPGWAFLEPVPWRKTRRQPILPDRTDPNTTDAVVLMTDVYHGPGLAGVPRGTVKSLRLVGYTYTFHGLGAEPDRVGLDGPWDIKQILGTVPVEADGSASFRVPACTPISLQPLDAEGKALALMRSWFTAAPGEVLSCAGCHEPQNTASPFHSTPLALGRDPSPITPWYGPARGFSFAREVQPVLDAYCTACHNGETFADGQANFDLTARPAERIPSAFQMHFSPSYMELRRWVHTPTLESDAHLLPPRDFHADASRLIQILRDDHYGVTLNGEAWDRLITWIDLNAPFHGTWQEVTASNPVKHAAARHGAARRRELHHRYAGIDEDPETIPSAAFLPRPALTQPPEDFRPLCFTEGLPDADPAAPENLPRSGGNPHPSPLPEGEGARRAGEGARFLGVPRVAPTSVLPSVVVELAHGVSLEMVRVEPGQFTMGSDHGYPNERPARLQRIAAPFFMGRFEVSNRQYRCFDSGHDSGRVTGEAYQFGDDERGFTLNRPEQPVVRVSWDQAMAFCGWLSETTGRAFSLPTETQWEYACRAGTATPLWYGTLDCDFSPYANFSDATHHTVYYPHVPNALPPWRPADTRFDDTWRVAAPVGAFAPNPWGLHDLHGNVAEWTRSHYHPFPAGAAALDDRAASAPGRKVVRGGSWLDCPKRGRSAFRLHYDASQAVFDVGFRVVCEP